MHLPDPQDLHDGKRNPGLLVVEQQPEEEQPPLLLSLPLGPRSPFFSQTHLRELRRIGLPGAQVADNRVRPLPGGIRKEMAFAATSAINAAHAIETPESMNVFTPP
jgi:hypothetical protein